jgi:hypothetical protein
MGMGEWPQRVGKAGLGGGDGARFMRSMGERPKEPQILRLRLPQKARQTSLRMTDVLLLERQNRGARAGRA